MSFFVANRYLRRVPKQQASAPFQTENSSMTVTPVFYVGLWDGTGLTGDASEMPLCLVAAESPLPLLSIYQQRGAKGSGGEKERSTPPQVFKLDIAVDAANSGITFQEKVMITCSGQNRVN